MSGKKRKRSFSKEVSPRGHLGQVRQYLSFQRIAVLLIVIAVSSAAVVIFLHFSRPAKAALVDHLSLTFPNQSFIDNTTGILEQAGYEVDYYPGEEVTVEFYSHLATHNYDIMILRVHSVAMAVKGEEFVEIPVSFFTSENYSQTRYSTEQSDGELVLVRYAGPPEYYFGITPRFVTASMNGRLQDATIIMMGCEGLTNTEMAEAFVERGAKVYIGWNQEVSASHTDTATIELLRHLVTEKQTTEQAVENTMKEVGPDPVYDSVLLYYPPDSGEHAILDKAGIES